MIALVVVACAIAAFYFGQVLGFTVAAVLSPFVLLLAWCAGFMDKRLNRWLDQRKKP